MERIALVVRVEEERSGLLLNKATFGGDVAWILGRDIVDKNN